MLTSLCMNILNIFGNAIVIYGFGMGVEGVGIATLISRIVAAIIMIVLIRIPTYDTHIESFCLKFDFQMIKQIL